MSRIFLIPGLAANTNVYKNIDLSGYDVTYIDWTKPAKKDTLATYAQNLIKQHDIIPGSIVIGNSMGGMMAVEIAKQVSLKKTIIISSIKSHDEAPWYFSLFRTLPVYVIIPGKVITTLGFWAKLVVYKLSPDEKEIYREMFKNTSPTFLKWAMKAILAWRNTEFPAGIHHINGNNDIVFSYKKLKNAQIIDNGNHAMIFDKADEINKLLKDILAS